VKVDAQGAGGTLRMNQGRRGHKDRERERENKDRRFLVEIICCFWLGRVQKSANERAGHSESNRVEILEVRISKSITYMHSFSFMHGVSSGQKSYSGQKCTGQIAWDRSVSTDFALTIPLPV